MSAPSFAQQPGTLLFHWERPRRRRFAIAGFLLASAGLHALCFYLFQVVYPPAISLLPPPAQVSVIAPTSNEARSFLNWLNAEDPALASQTQRPADARAFQLPKIAHVPSYLGVPPALKELPSRRVGPLAPAAMPPAPVPDAPAAQSVPPVVAPTALYLSDPLRHLTVAHPDLKFRRHVAGGAGERALSSRSRFVRRGPLHIPGAIFRRRGPRCPGPPGSRSEPFPNGRARGSGSRLGDRHF